MAALTRLRVARRRRSENARGVRAARWISTSCTALLLATSVAGCAGGGAGAGGAAHAVSEHPLLGSAAPALEVPTPDGKKKLSLSDYAGKVVIVDFWATWCQPCRESFPAYQSLVDEFGGKVVVLAVSVDEAPTDIAAFAKSTGAKFPVAWDEGQSAAGSYQPPKMPSSFIVDKHGIVRFVHGGFSPGDERELRNELRSLL
jgi:cytochrome c biogenesis protein CcmG/thiol:disulfide interchange protein DsbE